ncbi:arylamine N-acetyltransferase [Solirubrobacter phytolaccae]|uniref:Arylamine N-acetyltransferase n=1 Tax=Solirubrobacter phytolaccae TaxID=1404360 RepID=A0A9X3SJ58_9ACTN|nr:arylamine N-acetyltransferase [Solirubrobacter phytolaccae]MDA0184892.1 arylamine N-acetyltransferase [Solirubrobacter phytolaccae]
MVEALLRRIGLSARDVSPDLDGLFRVHRAYLEAIPYEDLAVQLGETGPLSPAELVSRLLNDGRGGYCFELNTVLGWLLTELGFELRYHQAVVGGEGPTNHMALVVDVDGSPWIADSGLGEGFMEPIPLEPGVAKVGPFAWTIELETCGTWWIGAHEWVTFPGFRMDEDPSPVSAFEPHHRRLATSPESPFVKTLVVQKPSVDRITTLRARTLSVVGPDVNTKHVVADETEFFHVLAGVFGITRREPRLWSQAVAQHDAWLAGTAPAGAASSARAAHPNV